MEWNDISKQQPPKSGRYLIVVSKCQIAIGWYERGNKLNKWTREDIDYPAEPAVTHWMELPGLPK